MFTATKAVRPMSIIGVYHLATSTICSELRSVGADLVRIVMDDKVKLSGVQCCGSLSA